MTKKLKVRVSALIMCAAMLATSMVVFAASKTETVGLDTTTNGKAFVEIYSSGLYARATTSGVSLYNDILYTSITGNGPDPREATGYSSIDVIPETKAFTSATSTHKWTSRSHTMTVYP